MRKAFSLVLAAVVALSMAIALTACGGSQSSSKNTAKDFDGSGIAETGEGTMYLVTSSGTSLEGTLTITVPKDSSSTHLGVCFQDFPDAQTTHVYVDGSEMTKGTYGDGSEVTLSLEGNAIKPGTHTVEAVQFSDNQTNGSPILYKKVGFEVKR